MFANLCGASAFFFFFLLYKYYLTLLNVYNFLIIHEETWYIVVQCLIVQAWPIIRNNIFFNPHFLFICCSVVTICYIVYISDDLREIQLFWRKTCLEDQGIYMMFFIWLLYCIHKKSTFMTIKLFQTIFFPIPFSNDICQFFVSAS